MHAIDRRTFLALMAAAGVRCEAAALRSVGVQLYTVRNILPKAPLETLRAIESIGYKEVEATAAGLDQIWPALKQTKLQPVSVHLDTALFLRTPDKLPAALDDVKQHGFEYAGCPYIAPQDRGGVEVIQKLGDTLNKAGEICRKSGLHLVYHNHAFEFEPAEDGTLLDVLMKTTDSRLVSLELDIMWAQVAGVDPVRQARRTLRP